LKKRCFSFKKYHFIKNKSQNNIKGVEKEEGKKVIGV
jgi:hypothetical protein